jgi:hypothetical protein
LLIQDIDQAIVQAHHLQVARPEFVGLVHDRFDAMEKKQQANENPQPKQAHE